MHHGFMADIATALAMRKIATLRFNFPFMESGGKRPDPPALAHRTICAAVAKARKLVPDLPVFAGGKSFGGRMVSQAQALGLLEHVPIAEPDTAPAGHAPPGVRGLVFLGFPLHPAGKASVTRADHLADVQVPMLFVQGTRDALADLILLRLTVEQLGSRASLKIVEDADHAFHVRKTIVGRNDAEVLQDIADAVAAWCVALVAARCDKS